MPAIAAPNVSDPRDLGGLRYAIEIAGIVCVYIVAGEIVGHLHELARAGELIWVPAGIGFGLILLYGPRMLPGVALGTFLSLLVRGPAEAALIVTATEIAEIVTGFYVLRALQFRKQLDRVRDVAAFTAVDLTTSAVGALLGATLFAAIGLVDHVSPLASTWWWLDITSDLIIVPAMLTWLAPSGRTRLAQRHRTAEAVVLATVGLVVIGVVIVFGGTSRPWLPITPAPYLLMPVLLWAGMRFGPRGAATASLVASSAAVVADSFGIGPFREHAALQAFVVISSVTTLMLSALSHERLRAVARKVAIQVGALDAIITLDSLGRVLELNPAAERLFDVREVDILGKELASFAIPDRLRATYEEGLRSYVEGKPGRVNSRYRTTARRASDGFEFPVEVAVVRVPVDDQHVFTGFVRDVTAEHVAEAVRQEAKAELERKVAERTAQLEDALREKEVLLREVHHRVKNNLQVISSLLNLQLSSEPAESTRRGLRESQNRILSMALVHQLLYRSKDFPRIDVGDYLRDLVAQVVGAYNVGPERGTTEVTAPTVPLDLDRAIPCGLIVNELVANALEHAFPPPRTGSVRVRLEEHERHLELTIADDGIGMTAPFAEDTSTFGLRIVKTLALQLDGKVERIPATGTVIRVTFPRAPAEPA